MKLSETQRHWDAFAKEDPMWAILVDAEKKGNRWKPEEFFATGQRDAAQVMARLKSYGLEPGNRNALDFGCGLGRVTQGLAAHFDKVCGVDISEEMVRQAREVNQFGDRVEYVWNTDDRLTSLQSGSFDFVHSVIVLQHVEPQYAKRYISEFLRVLRPGGVAFFQLPEQFLVRAWIESHWPSVLRFAGWMPDWLLRRAFQMWDSTFGLFPRMEMHAVASGEVRALVEAGGGEMVAMLDDSWAGPYFISHTYVVSKPEK